MPLKGQSKKKGLISKKEDEPKKQESKTNSEIKKTQSLNSEIEKNGKDTKSSNGKRNIIEIKGFNIILEDLKDKINDFDNNKTEDIKKIEIVPKSKTRLTRASKISKENIVSEPKLSNNKLSKNGSKTKNDELSESSNVELPKGRKKSKRISANESITSNDSGDSISTSTRKRKINKKDVVSSTLTTIGETETLEFENDKKDVEITDSDISAVNSKKKSEQAQSEVSPGKLKRKNASKLKRSTKLVKTSEEIESQPKTEVIPGLKLMELMRKQSIGGVEIETKSTPIKKSRTSRAQTAKQLNKEVDEKETDKNNNIITNSQVESIPEVCDDSPETSNSIKRKPRKSTKVADKKEDKIENKPEKIPGIRSIELVKNRKSLLNLTNDEVKKSTTTKEEERTKKLDQFSVPTVEKKNTFEIDSNEIKSTPNGQSRLLRNKFCITEADDIDESPIKTVTKPIPTLKRGTPVVKYNLNETASPAVSAQISMTNTKFVPRKSSGMNKELEDIMGRIEAKIPGLSALQQRKSLNLENKQAPLKSVKKSISTTTNDKIPGLKQVPRVEVPKLTAQTISEKTDSVSQKRKIIDEEDVYEPSVKKCKVDESNNVDVGSLPQSYMNKDLLGFDVFSPIRKSHDILIVSDSNNIFSTPRRNVYQNKFQFSTPQPIPESPVRDFISSTPKTINDPMDIMRKTPVHKNICSRRRSILNTTNRHSNNKSFVETPRRQNVKFDETVEYKEILGNSFDSEPMEVDDKTKQPITDYGQDNNDNLFVFGSNTTVSANDDLGPKYTKSDKPYHRFNLSDLFVRREDDFEEPQPKSETNTESMECQESVEGDKKAACSIM